MKIAFITSCSCFGGAEKMLCWVATELQQFGHDTVIIDLKSNVNNVDFERSIDPRIKVIPAQAKGFKGLKRLKQILDVKQILVSEQIDIVVGFTSYPNFLASICGKIARIPSIISERCDPAVELQNRIAKFYHYFINKANGAVFQIEGAKSFYTERLQNKSVTIPNPIFISESAQEPEYKNKAIVSVGRLDNYQKRYDVMIGAFSIFAMTHPEYTLKLYGDGADAEQIRQWINESDVSDRIEMCGLTEHPMTDMIKNEMFVITSDFEGISNSLLEAMAIGMPVVSTDCRPGGSRMLIENNVNGQLVPIGDSQAIAEALSRFADDKVFRIACSTQAKNVNERFAPTKIISLWNDYIKKIAFNN